MYIYEIYSKDPEDPNVYIGSTNNFKRRMWEHKSHCCNEKSEKHNLFIYNYIRSHGGWDSFDSEIIHEFECKDDKEKRMMEQEYINRYSFGLNSKSSYQTTKQYSEANKEKNKQYQKQYREANKEKIAAKGKIKFTCECGSTLRKSDKAKHEKSKKHQKYIEENNIII